MPSNRLKQGIYAWIYTCHRLRLRRKCLSVMAPALRPDAKTCEEPSVDHARAHSTQTLYLRS